MVEQKYYCVKLKVAGGEGILEVRKNSGVSAGKQHLPRNLPGESGSAKRIDKKDKKDGGAGKKSVCRVDCPGNKASYWALISGNSGGLGGSSCSSGGKASGSSGEFLSSFL